MSANIFDVANCLLIQEDPEAGEGISNMKMQKLCYYAQGFHLALNGTRLFEDDVEAWLHGPVVPRLYDKYKEYKNQPIPVLEDISWDSLSPEIQDLLSKIYRLYGQYAAWILRNMTHEELPWLNAKRKEIKKIADKDMINFFKTQLDILEDV
jgi:uncharacterized phage-associated protein